MPREKKRRRCRLLPSEKGFKPIGKKCIESEKIYLETDEFEAVRLCDYEGNNQIEAAEKMHISRGTVQRLLNSARSKIIESLLQDKVLVIKNNCENSLPDISNII